MKLSENQYMSDSSLFWDSNVDDLDPNKDYFYIIKRILLKGDSKHRAIMFEQFSKDKINEVLKKSREINDNLKAIYLRAIND